MEEKIDKDKKKMIFIYALLSFTWPALPSEI